MRRSGLSLLAAGLLVATASAGGAPTSPPPDSPRPAPAARGYWQWHQNGEPVRDDAWRRSDGPFGAMLFLTAQAEEFIEAWERPDHAGYAPKMNPVAQARRGEIVAAMVLFGSCGPDASGNCDARADWKVLAPDGSVYAEQPDTEVWSLPPPPSKNLQLSRTRLALRIEPEDPLGTYRVQVVIHDRAARRTVTLVRDLVVREAAAR